MAPLMQTTSVVGMGCCDRAMPTLTCLRHCRHERTHGRVVQAMDGGSGLRAVWSVIAVAGVRQTARALEDEDGRWGGSGCSSRQTWAATSGRDHGGDGWPGTFDPGSCRQ
ncbi:hypothetical protein ACLOJK_034786 [Asimina triloba]